MRVHSILILSLLLLLLLPLTSKAQHRSATDAILLGAVIEGNDTIPMVYIDEIEKIAALPKHLAKKREAYNRLKYNIYKVYPYAVIASEVLKDVDVTLAKLENDKKGRKAYLNSVEKELNKRFKGELEDLTISQGQVLVKLINRQTGKNCFNIVKELKGGFSAVVFQSVALLFSNSLKKEYDARGADRDMELIVAELESNNYYKYKYQLQQSKLHTKVN
jgi:hypothetical protein